MSSNVRRTLVLVGLLAIYIASGLRPLVGALRRGGFDALQPKPRALDQRIAEGRFAEALPIALDLERAFPAESEVALRLARVHEGLRDFDREAAAWERYVATSKAPEDACPALPESYARAGRPDESLRAYERCAGFDERDPARLIDLGDAYVRANRVHDARDAYERAKAFDAGDPGLLSRIAALPGPQADTR